MSGIPNIPPPRNEPILSYAPGSPERATLKAELARLTGEVADIPAIVGGKEVRSGDMLDVTSPHKHRHVIARAHKATADTVRAAAKSAIDSQREWAALRFEDRAAVFLRAAEMLATTHRALLNGSTMLGQSKTAFQAEIDSACELIDFFRFNVAYAERLYHEQPESSPGVSNRMEHRPLEGFVYAVTPFNFTAIGACRCTGTDGQHRGVAVAHGILAAITSTSCWRRLACRRGSSTSCRRGGHAPRRWSRPYFAGILPDQRLSSGRSGISSRAGWTSRLLPAHRG
jgi:1-pyrroline-5-carboxylate dehydrogenase